MRRNDSELQDQLRSSRNEWEESWSCVDAGEEERKKIHHELCSLMEKYEEMARKMGVSLLVDQLLTSTDLPYSVEVMATSVPPKLKVPYMEMYDGSRNPFNTWKHLRLI